MLYYIAQLDNEAVHILHSNVIIPENNIRNIIINKSNIRKQN